MLFFFLWAVQGGVDKESKSEKMKYFFVEGGGGGGGEGGMRWGEGSAGGGHFKWHFQALNSMCMLIMYGY